ncbi:glycosyltransferase [Marinospirillum minutulum]|uniref:glycosyltransferase n=1 Tax=Marinospirillum minutulum TaxID=64974 RepID=UPI00041738C1|nr:glycosyltransferase [Marinospirillum minutulum]
MPKIRVLQIVGDPVGGIRKHIHDIILGLVDEFDFYYVSSNKGDKVYDNQLPDILKATKLHCNLKIFKKPAVSDISNIYKIYRTIKKNKIQVVHGHGAKGGLYARVAGRLAGCKVIYTPHGGAVHSMFSPTFSLIYKCVEVVLSYFTDLFIFESQYTFQKFKVKFGIGRSSFIVNYNGVRAPKIPATFNYSTKNEKIKFGIFGMFRFEKGQDIAAQAISELIDMGKPIELHFYGDGDLKEKLEKKYLIKKYGLSIKFHGEVDNVNDHMMNMDFILIPSRFESFGYIAVEAALMKLPIISSDAGALTEVLNINNTFFFESGNIDDLKRVISVALDAELEVIQEFVKKNYLYSQRFSIENMLNNLKSKYEA